MKRWIRSGGVSLFVVLAYSLNARGSVPPAEEYWMWGHHPDSFDVAAAKGEVYNVPKGRRIDMADACRSMGLDKCCVVRWRGLPAYPYDDYAEQFTNLDEIAWSIVDSGREAFAWKQDEALRLAARHGNLTTFFLDDFFNGDWKKLTPPELASFKERAKAVNPKSRLACVLYADENGINPAFKPSLDVCDVVSLWFWNGKSLSTMQAKVGELRKLIGPTKTVLLGIYLWDFGGKKPLTREETAAQLDTAGKLLDARWINGLIFHCTPLVDLNLDSVAYAREWLKNRKASRAVVSRKPLPDEPCTKPALPPAPFPDRMSAFVWRNWGLVPVDRMAETIGASRDDVNDIAADMGLRRNPTVLPEWETKGYITVLRRNWHLLPYDQLMTLLGKTRDELYFSLMEDDFLWAKLGYVKPKCEELKWSAEASAKWKMARKRIANILKEEGLDPNAPEEPRFAFIKDIAAPQAPTPNVCASGSPFDFRLIFSYFADYGDPLADPEIASFPEGLLQKLSSQGVNAVWLHTVLRTLAKDPKYPEFGAGSENRIANLRTLVARAKKYGIRVFLYMNEPRAQPESFFARELWRKDMKGAPDGVRFAMCTSNPETLRWLSDALEQVFAQVQGLGGIFTITMSENLTNCASRGRKADCPRCKERKTGDIVANVNCAMVEGMLRGNPDAEALIWNWQWPKDEEAQIVSRLPKRNIRLMAVSENAMKICRGGVEVLENDYSISIVGPGENARRLWGYAGACGIPSVAKVQAANSWELSSFPYLPVMDLVAQHAVNLSNAGVQGVMLSWSLGCCPSPNLAVYRDLKKGETTPDGVLDRMAKRLYGSANIARVRQAWKAFSDGFANYPFSLDTIYNGPQQWGPANPLYAEKTGYSATMVGIPYDDLKGWCSEYPPATYAELMGKVADGFAQGCRLLEGVADKKELAMFRAEQMHFASCCDQARFVMAREAGNRAEMVRLARAEKERAKAYWQLVRADSRIGYESSNHYFFVPQDVLEKVLSCRHVEN